MPPEAQIHKSVVVPGTALDTRKVCEQILSRIREYNYSQNDIFAIHLALEEAFINAVKHGNKMDPSKNIKIEYTIMPDKVDISITDQGRGFDTEKLPDPRLDENLYKTNGRGLFLIRSYMTKTEFNKTGNRIRMIKYKDTKSGSN
jgi:serine/threonine-protein kinase RsbW